MIFINTRPNKYNLLSKQYDIIIQENNNYLEIKQLHQQYGSGISSFLLYINQQLYKHNSYVLLQCIDAEGQYVQIYDTQFLQSGYHRIAIRIKNQNIDGITQLLISGITKKNQNILYQNTFSINKKINNTTVVRYIDNPILYCTRKQYLQQQILSEQNNHQLQITNTYYQPLYKAFVCKFTSDELSKQTIQDSYFIRLQNKNQLNTSSQIKFINNNTVLIKPAYSKIKQLQIQLINKNINIHTFTTSKIDQQQQITRSMLNLKFQGIKPVCGYIDSMNIFYRSKSQGNSLQYTFLSNIKLQNKQLIGFNKRQQKSAGNFTLQNVQKFWNINQEQYLINSDYILNGLLLTKTPQQYIYTQHFVLAYDNIKLDLNQQPLVGNSLQIIGNTGNILLQYKEKIKLNPYKKYQIKFKYIALSQTACFSFKLFNDENKSNIVSIIELTQQYKLYNYSIKFSPQFFINKSQNNQYTIRLQFDQFNQHVIGDIVVQQISQNDQNVSYFQCNIQIPLIFKGDKIDFKVQLLDRDNKRCYDFLYFNNVDIIGTGLQSMLTQISGWQLDDTSLYNDKVKIDSQKKGLFISDNIKQRVAIQQKINIRNPLSIKIFFKNNQLQELIDDTTIPTGFTFYDKNNQQIEQELLTTIITTYNKDSVKDMEVQEEL